MSISDGLMLMLTFGTFLITLLTFVISLIEKIKK